PDGNVTVVYAQDYDGNAGSALPISYPNDSWSPSGNVTSTDQASTDHIIATVTDQASAGNPEPAPDQLTPGAPNPQQPRAALPPGCTITIGPDGNVTVVHSQDYDGNAGTDASIPGSAATPATSTDQADTDHIVATATDPASVGNPEPAPDQPAPGAP